MKNHEAHGINAKELYHLFAKNPDLKPEGLSKSRYSLFKFVSEMIKSSRASYPISILVRVIVKIQWIAVLCIPYTIYLDKKNINRPRFLQFLNLVLYLSQDPFNEKYITVSPFLLFLLSVLIISFFLYGYMKAYNNLNFTRFQSSAFHFVCCDVLSLVLLVYASSTGIVMNFTLLGQESYLMQSIMMMCTLGSLIYIQYLLNSTIYASQQYMHGFECGYSKSVQTQIPFVVVTVFMTIVSPLMSIEHARIVHLLMMLVFGIFFMFQALSFQYIHSLAIVIYESLGMNCLVVAIFEFFQNATFYQNGSFVIHSIVGSFFVFFFLFRFLYSYQFRRVAQTFDSNSISEIESSHQFIKYLRFGFESGADQVINGTFCMDHYAKFINYFVSCVVLRYTSLFHNEPDYINILFKSLPISSNRSLFFDFVIYEHNKLKSFRSKTRMSAVANEMAEYTKRSIDGFASMASIYSSF